MARDDGTVTVYSDYVCPFCYLGRRSLDRYQETRADALAIDWHPFDLRSNHRGPDGDLDDAVDDWKDGEYFAQVRQNVARLKAEYGADEMLALEELPEPVDSLDAQVASSYVDAEHPDRWLPFDEAVFGALWVEGRDIGDVDVLVDVADSVGVEGGQIRGAVADEDRRERLRDRFAAARQAGITGVPTFVYEGRAARGAVAPDRLARLVEGS